LAGISIFEKKECFVRPCRPWQGRRQEWEPRRIKSQKPEKPEAAPLGFWAETPKPARRLTRRLRRSVAMRSLRQTLRSVTAVARSEAQPPRPHYGFANGGAVRCNAGFCKLFDWNRRAKPKTKPDSVSSEGESNRGSHCGGASLRRRKNLVDKSL